MKLQRRQPKYGGPVDRHGDSTTSRWHIFAKVKFVRVCVEYMYVVGYSLGLGVILGVGLEYESDSILGSLINRGACLL